MHPNIESMMNRYNPSSTAQAIQALREIIQEIALVALYRSKFFDKAAFYGGTSLRIFYGLDRFSEDLDFSLLKEDEHFSLDEYNQAIMEELSSYGFNVNVETKPKGIDSQIKPAFIKANTQKELIHVGLSAFTLKGIARDAKIKIKLELDTLPPGGFETESKFLFEPIPVPIKTYKLEYLFAGKMHALLFRAWGKRIKGRDWYDFVWFVQKKIPLSLHHLEARMRQSDHIGKHETLSKEHFIKLLIKKIDELDVTNAQMDIRPFINDPIILQAWSKEYFTQISDHIRFHT